MNMFQKWVSFINNYILYNLFMHSYYANSVRVFSNHLYINLYNCSFHPFISIMLSLVL